MAYGSRSARSWLGPSSDALLDTRIEGADSLPERRIIRRRCDRMMPKVLVDLGALRGLIYSADRDGCGRVKTFIHFMETPPRLMCDPQGNQLYVIGGRYRITRRGIEG